MGPVGTPELMFIILLALLLFGPKELPKIGRTIGKAMTEFRRAQAELKSTFDREMKNLERETGLQELTATSFQANSYNYDQTSFDPSHYDASHYEGSWEGTETNTSTGGASAIQGAVSTAPLQLEAATGSIPNGQPEPAHDDHATASVAIAEIGHAEQGHSATAETPEKVNV
jgi:sec-independent protein translocase protein TatA